MVNNGTDGGAGNIADNGAGTGQVANNVNNSDLNAIPNPVTVTPTTNPVSSTEYVNNVGTESVVNNEIPANNTECRSFEVNQLMISNAGIDPMINLNLEVPQVSSNPYLQANNPDNVPDGNTQMEKCLNSVWRTVLQVFSDNRPQNCPVVSDDTCDARCMPDDFIQRIINSVNNIYTTNANCLSVSTRLNGQCYFGIIPYDLATEFAWYGSVFAIRFGAMNYKFNSCENLLNTAIYTEINI